MYKNVHHGSSEVFNLRLHSPFLYVYVQLVFPYGQALNLPSVGIVMLFTEVYISFLIGVSITRNKFGFVQFEEEEEAMACLAAGSNAYIDGHRVGECPFTAITGERPTGNSAVR